MSFLQRTNPIPLESIFYGNLSNQFSTLGLAILSPFQKTTFATTLLLSKRTSSEAKENHKQNMDIHGSRMGCSYVGHNEFFDCLYPRGTPTFLGFYALYITDLGIRRFFIWILYVVLSRSKTKKKDPIIQGLALTLDPRSLLKKLGQLMRLALLSR